MCLQETHFSPDPAPSFSPRVYCTQFHSTHSAYSRGVSVLIRRDTQFHCIQKLVDQEGRYIFLLCNVSGLSCILAAIYILPPYSSEVLKRLANFIAQFPTVPLLAVGDYNNYINHQLDKLPVPSNVPLSKGGRTSFTGLLEELGLTDLWRLGHPLVKQYSCCSASYGSLSRIDLGLGNDLIIPLIVEAGYNDRHISDHSSLWVPISLPNVTKRKC